MMQRTSKRAKPPSSEPDIAGAYNPLDRLRVCAASRHSIARSQTTGLDPKLSQVASRYAGSPAVRSASDKGSAIDAWKPTAAHIPLMV